MNGIAKLAGIALIGLAFALCLAQQAVNTQVNNSVATPSATGTVRYSSQPTYRMMPSEVRNDYWTSGMLPGEVRGNYMSLGPMTTEGQSAYFQPQPGRNADNVSGSSYTDGRVDPTSGPKIPSTPVWSSPSAAGSSDWGASPSAVGSVRYSNASSSNQVQHANLASQPVGSVRYDSRVR